MRRPRRAGAGSPDRVDRELEAKSVVSWRIVVRSAQGNSGDPTVVITDDRYLTRYVDAVGAERGQQPEGAAVVEDDHAGRQHPLSTAVLGDHQLSAAGTVPLGESADCSGVGSAALIARTCPRFSRRCVDTAAADVGLAYLLLFG